MIKELDKVVNKWRIVPRIMVIGYGYVFYEVVQWFMLLVAPTNQHVTFVSVIVGSAAAFFGLYVNSGDKNDS